jgi:AraC family transcriptional activator FtrA
MKQLSVAVLALDGVVDFELGVAAELFCLQRPYLTQFYEGYICGAQAGQICTQAGLSIQIEEGIDALAGAHMVVVPAYRDFTQTPEASVIAALRAASVAGSRIVSLCTGAFALGYAGLLEGKKATTHWLYAEQFQQHFPDAAYQDNVLYVTDAGVATSAGSAAGIDLGLHLIDLDFGAEAAHRVARRMVIAPHREGGQAQYVERAMPRQPAGLAPVMDWARASLGKGASVDVNAMAAKAHMSRRTFDRQFRKLTAQSPKQWLIGERVVRAKELLETSQQPMETIAQYAGFGSAMLLRHHFRDRLGISPAHYRRRFAREQA